jgi:hypothetical protein
VKNKKGKSDSSESDSSEESDSGKKNKNEKSKKENKGEKDKKDKTKKDKADKKESKKEKETKSDKKDKKGKSKKDDDSDDSDNSDEAADVKEEGHNFKKLKESVIDASRAKTWEEAKLEWKLEKIYRSDDKEKCICGHNIIEKCVIINRCNDKRLIIGNVCIDKFDRKDLGVSKAAFASLRKLIKHKGDASASIELVDLAEKLGILGKTYADSYRKYSVGKNSRARVNKKSSKYNGKADKSRYTSNCLFVLGFSADRPDCKCDESILAMPRYTPKDDGKYFYTCANWNGAKNSGCGFFEWVDDPFE